jgi:hypothetical protein
VSTGAEALAALITDTVGAAGHTYAAVSLDRDNRLGARLGCVAPSPNWCWKQADDELFICKSAGLVIPAPASEDELATADVAAAMEKAIAAADALVVDLGCRWTPRLFRPVLARATHIWLIVRAGQWSAVEMRLEQADFSGWTAMDRLRLVVVGEGIPVPAGLAEITAAVLPDFSGAAAREFVWRELGGART